MITLEDVKVIDEIFKKINVELSDIEVKEVKKIELLMEQIKIQEETSEKISKIQESINEL